MKEMKCKICGEPCEEQDFCYGCQRYVCLKCSDTYPDVPSGKHSVSDHLFLKQALIDLKKAQEEVDRITDFGASKNG